MKWGDYPGTCAPDRVRTVSSHGIALAVYEWGQGSATPLFLAHGGADFARTFDAFAPLLAQGGYRVVSWDHRGHGDSERAQLYSWPADVRDAKAVLDSLGREPVVAVGHSKGGGLLIDLCEAFPERFRRFVNIDGIPSRGGRSKKKLPLEERLRGRDRWHQSYLDARRKLHDAQRRPGTREELAERRARHNPRLSMDWLRYLVTVGAFEDVDGWRWKLDPLVRMMNPGPWRPDWGLRTLQRVEVPMLAILGRVHEPMGWGTDPDQVRELLPDSATVEVLEDSGHFVHIEHPERVARLVLDFLSDRS